MGEQPVERAINNLIDEVEELTETLTKTMSSVCDQLEAQTEIVKEQLILSRTMVKLAQGSYLLNKKYYEKLDEE